MPRAKAQSYYCSYPSLKRGVTIIRQVLTVLIVTRHFSGGYRVIMIWTLVLEHDVCIVTSLCATYCDPMFLFPHMAGQVVLNETESHVDGDERCLPSK
jgi:hypothetical protein